MHSPSNSLKHIVPCECRTLNATYFKDSAGKGYTFIILLHHNISGIFIPKIQVGNLKGLPKDVPVIVLEKENGSTEVVKVDISKYLRIDEFELVRRCLEGHKSLEDLMRASTFNPIANIVYRWFIEIQRDYRLHKKNVYQEIRETFMEANLESLYRSAWLT